MHTNIPPPLHTHSLTPPALTSSPPVTLGFEELAYNVSEDDRPFSVCVRVTKGQLEDQITITINNNDTEAIGMYLKSAKSVQNYLVLQKFSS